MSTDDEDLATPRSPAKYALWGLLLGCLLFTGIAIGVFLSGIWRPFWDETYGKAQERKYLADMQQMLSEVDEWRAAGITEADWHQRAAVFQTRLGVISDDLVQTASRKFPSRQFLLWAARDRFPSLLEAGLTGDQGQEDELRHNLERAQELLDAN
ncbi:hypothetical protein GC163_23570 [bacterium]|nr:hypothetical protein [bacterium]